MHVEIVVSLEDSSFVLTIGIENMSCVSHEQEKIVKENAFIENEHIHETKNMDKIEQ